MKFLLLLLRNNLLQLSHANQLRYADTKNRKKAITLYILVAVILAPLPELMDRKKRDIMERKGDKEDENKRQKQQKESSAAAL